MIVLLTYSEPHRKTFDVACRLLAAGRHFCFVVLPWVRRKPRRYLFGHRPAEREWPCEWSMEPEILASNLHKECYFVKDADGSLFTRLAELDPALVVVGGAGILSREVVEAFKVLNVHPGYLPQSRGLDALKYAVLTGKKVGVTSHLVDHRADLGWKIAERAVPVYRDDSFQQFAMRQYEYELDLIAPSVERVLGGYLGQEIEEGDSVSTRRLPLSMECGLPEAFEQFKRRYAA